MAMQRKTVTVVFCEVTETTEHARPSLSSRTQTL
jgi:hypothetical protein